MTVEPACSETKKKEKQINKQNFSQFLSGKMSTRLGLVIARSNGAKRDMDRKLSPRSGLFDKRDDSVTPP